MPEQKAPELFAESWPITEDCFKLWQAFVNEVVAGMFLRFLVFCFGCEFDRGLGDLQFISVSSFADSFDHVAVTIA